MLRGAVLFLLISLSVEAGQGVRLQGTFVDAAFSENTPVHLELLETGDSLTISSGESFGFLAPEDTVWNLCARSTSLQKCYVIYGRSNDTLLNVRIDASTPVSWVDTDFRVDSSALAENSGVTLDSLVNAADSTEKRGESERDLNATRLRKVSLRLKKTPKRTLGKSTISAKSIKRMPGLAEADVIRSIQALPGVVSSSDFSTKLYVRGGGADQNLFLFDNGVVYSPVHFFGLFSTFLVEGIDEVDFYKGGFPPKYGNRLSSVIDIKSRKGGNDSVDTWFDGSVKVSTFATQVHTEGRQDSLSWLIAGRTTYIKQVLDLLKTAGVIDFVVDYKFTDLQGNVNYSFGKDRWLMFSTYSGEDRLLFEPVTTAWGNLLYSLNFNWRFDENWSTHLTTSYSRFNQYFGMTNLFRIDNDIVNRTAKLSLLFEGWDKHLVSVGTDVSHIQTAFGQDIEVVDFSVEDRIKFWLIAGYVQDRWDLGKFELISGLRSTYQDAADHRSVEPRVSLKYRPDRVNQIDFHVGYYYQYINSILWGDRENLNEFYYPASRAKYKRVPPSNSLMLSTGWTRSKIYDDYTFILEGYYKTQNDLLIFAPEDQPDSIRNDVDARLGDFFKRGEGYSLGYEVTLKKENGPVSGDINFAQGYSVILEELDTLAYYPDWHQPFSLKSTISLNWRGRDGIRKNTKNGNYFRSSSQIKWAAGLPYTEKIGYMGCHNIDQSAGSQNGGPPYELANCTQTVLGNRNTSFVPAYFRWDLKLIDIGREDKWNFSWTILNVTNHENVFLLTYDTSENPPQENKITQFPFFPLLFSYEYYF